MDTAVATQALSEYSTHKLGVSEVNLHCNVSTNPMQNYSHAFDFNADNAITPKSLSNVPVGRQLRVETRGTGLGQMQVRVEYNVPVEANADCRYNVTINRRIASPSQSGQDGDEVCRYCQMGCDDNDEEGNGGNDESRRRQQRHISFSRVTICIDVCIRSTDDMYADRTIVDVGMLSGYLPLRDDLTRIYAKKEQLSLSNLIYDPERVSVEMKFNQIPHDRDTCVSFRALEKHDVERRNPAVVTVRSHEDPEPTCVHTYDPVVSEVNLEVYCASNQSNNHGQCRCFSGLCGRCYTNRDYVSLGLIRTLACDSQYIYKIAPPSTTLSDDWVDMRANVIGISKNGSEAVEPQIHLVTPRSCTCPHRAGYNAPHFFFGSQVTTFVDRHNQQKKTYLVDHSTTFVLASSDMVNDPNRTANFINSALRDCSN